MNRTRTSVSRVLLVILLLASTPSVAGAYVGPGSGLAFLTSFAVAIGTGMLALVSLLVWPFRVIWRLVMRRRQPKVRRLILLGFDGHDAQETEERMARGELPNFQRLALQGCYYRLRTANTRGASWGDFCQGHDQSIPGTSRPFWTILGASRVWSTVLRVPERFTPDRFFGAQLCITSGEGARKTGRVSHPRYYSRYLAKKAAPESADTTELETEAICADALSTLRSGALVCVFTANSPDAAAQSAHSDALMGRMMQKLNAQDLLIVFSNPGATASSGIFFCNRPIARADPALIDLAPTALERFGIEVPAAMGGRSLFTREPGAALS